MISLGNLLLALLAPTVPDGLAVRVRDALAREWRVPSDAVRLEWGPIGPRVELADSSSFRLMGRGLGGRFVMVAGAGREQVAVSFRAGIEDSVWVASRPLVAGATVVDGDIVRALRVVWGPPTERGAVPVGWEVTRSLGAGEPLAATTVREPALVQPGDPVRFEWSEGGISISREGVATNKARRGETVRAEAVTSKERIAGIVVGPGRARLTRGNQ